MGKRRKLRFARRNNEMLARVLMLLAEREARASLDDDSTEEEVVELMSRLVRAALGDYMRRGGQASPLAERALGIILSTGTGEDDP